MRTFNPSKCSAGKSQDIVNHKIDENFRLLSMSVKDINDFIKRFKLSGTPKSAGLGNNNPPGHGGGPHSDEFRNYHSLINFIYDYKGLTTDTAGKPTSIAVKSSGSGGPLLATITPTYNSDEDPASVSIVGANTGTITFGYDTNGILSSVART